MNITPVGIAIALAVAVALAFLFFGPSVFTPFQTAPAAGPVAASSGLGSGSTTPPAGVPSNPTSLQVNDVSVGTGAEAEAGDTITVNYVGALTDGTVFDASASHPETKNGFTFTLGAGQVIPGWDQGIAGMKVGGERMLVIPASLGYGAQAVGSIPPNSALVFEVQLLDVKKGQ